MGHYWRDIDPEGAEQADRRHEIMREILELQKSLRTQPASKFTAGQILDIGTDPRERGRFSYDDADNSKLLNRLKIAFYNLSLNDE